MYFDSLQSLLYMDGHGAFVWGAYTITLLVVGAMLMLPRRRETRLLRQLAGDIRRQAGPGVNAGASVIAPVEKA
jgi:heme exporter protein D